MTTTFYRLPTDTRRRHTRMPWATPSPLSRLGWWRRCSGLADSPTISLGIFWPGSNLRASRSGKYFQSCGLVEGFTPNWVSSPPDWTPLQGWSASSSSWSAGTERCTFFIPSSLIPVVTDSTETCLLSFRGGIHLGVSAGYPRSQWPPSRCGALSAPS